MVQWMCRCQGKGFGPIQVAPQKIVLCYRPPQLVKAKPIGYKQLVSQLFSNISMWPLFTESPVILFLPSFV